MSVVTPFFNTDKYLSECIESVLNQSYRNWEYILVNNRSTDRSLEIARSYAEKEPRIHIFENDVFLTQIQNYNRALRLISPQSQYCKIVQADDWIFPNCLTEMIAVAERNPSVGIVGAYRLDDKQINCDGLPYPSTVVSGKHISRLYLLERVFVYGSPTSVLFRSNIVRNRNSFYAESTYYADTAACTEILQSWDFGFAHQVLTFTRRENESISTVIRRFDPQYLLNYLVILLKYGRNVLNEAEYQECLRNAETQYYQFLGRKLWSRNRRKFLNYHIEGLKDAHYQLRFSKMLRYAFCEFGHIILDPKRVMGRFLRSGYF